MCKVGIIFDDSLNTATNVPFIDTIANILRDSNKVYPLSRTL